MTGTIYALKDPRTPWRIRYVGQTTNLMARLHSHLCRYDKGYNQKSLLAWFRDMKKAGVMPQIEVLECVPVQSMNRAEREWMAFYDLFFPLLNSPCTFRAIRN